MSTIELIAALRGEWPKACDFCQKPFNETRHPIPEEAGEWACTDCTARWAQEGIPPYAKPQGA